jgi:protein O-mannosyl-transferase
MKLPRTSRNAVSVERQEIWKLADLLLSGLLIAATIGVYAQVRNFGFVIVDDPSYVPQNPHVLEGLTIGGLKWSWTSIHDFNWIPLTWLSLMLDTNVYSGRAGGYHITNIVLHAANAVILYLAIAAATGARGRSAAVAALFALHPLHVESVAWIAERKDVLSTLFGLLSLLFYVRYAAGGGRRKLWASTSFLVLSLLSKQTLVTLPFVFLLLDYWPLARWKSAGSESLDLKQSVRRSRQPQREATVSGSQIRARQRKLVAEKIPCFVVSGVFSTIALFAQSHGGAVVAFHETSLSARIANAVLAYAGYLEKAINPQCLAVYYPHPGESLDWTVLGSSAVVLLVTTVIVVYWARRYPFLFVGWFWFLGTLVPMIGLVQIGSQQMADRYTYFPLIGIFLAISWLVPELVPAGPLRDRVLPATAVASLALLAVTTYSQISYWHDSVALLSHSLECTADNTRARQYLGIAYLQEGSPHEGVEELQKAVRLSPAQVDLRNQLGDALQYLGRLDEAATQYREALALDPQSPQVQTNLGLVFQKQGKFEEAKREYRQALNLDKDFVPAHINTAALCFATGDYAGAIEHSQRVLDLQPAATDSELCIAMSLRQQGHFDEAIRRIQHVLVLKPDDPVARQELARTKSMNNPLGQPNQTP